MQLCRKSQINLKLVAILQETWDQGPKAEKPAPNSFDCTTEYFFYIYPFYKNLIRTINSTPTMKRITLLLAAAFIATIINAQTRSDVVTAFNEGAKTAPTDAVAAITAFEKAITLADQVGADAADLKEKATKALPGLYTKLTVAAINEKKPAAEVIKAAKKGMSIAEKYGTQTHKDNASRLLVQAYNTQATTFFNQTDYNNAIASFDSALLINPNYANAIYNKSLIYIKLNNPEAYEQTIDLYIEKLKATNDTVKIRQASSQAMEYFRSAGSRANQTGKLDEALSMLNKAEKYGADKDLCYYLADVYNKQNNFDKGLEYAKKGLDMESGEGEAKAKFYFQMGLAQEGKGQIADACASFKNALFGPFAEPSKAKRANLKCQ